MYQNQLKITKQSKIYVLLSLAAFFTNWHNMTCGISAYQAAPVKRLQENQSNSHVLEDHQSSSSSIQPEGRLWQEPEPSQATGMALAHCIKVYIQNFRMILGDLL